MKQIVVPEEDLDFPGDVLRIIGACEADGYDISGVDAAELWKRYSATYSAEWLGMPTSDDGIVRVMLRFGEVIEEGQ